MMNKPTQAMISFAENIIEQLEIDKPDMNSYQEVSMFISDNKEQYFESIR